MKREPNYKYNYNVQDCPYYEKDSCPNKNRKGLKCEQPVCILHVQIDLLQYKSKIPEFYRKPITLAPDPVDRALYKNLMEFKNNIHQHVIEGHSALFQSKYTGNGKTSWACITGIEYIKQIADGNGEEDRLLFISTSKFMADYRNSFSGRNPEFAYLLKKVMEIDLLIMDDMGVDPLSSDWGKSALYDIINHRYQTNKATIFTTNVSSKEFQTNVGSRTFSRILGMCADRIYIFRGVDHRVVEKPEVLGW